MRAKVGHPVLREVVVRIAEVTLEKKEKGELKVGDMASLGIIEWTGPAVWTDSIFWGMNSQTMTGRGTKAGADMEEWSWVQFTGITEPKVPIPLSLVSVMTDGSKLVIYWCCQLLGSVRE